MQQKQVEVATPSVTKVMYEAIDGTLFMSPEKCKEWEGSWNKVLAEFIVTLTPEQRTRVERFCTIANGFAEPSLEKLAEVQANFPDAVDEAFAFKEDYPLPKRYCNYLDDCATFDTLADLQEALEQHYFSVETEETLAHAVYDLAAEEWWQPLPLMVTTTVVINQPARVVSVTKDNFLD